MELEALSNLAWLLLSGSVFFVAMRYAAKRQGRTEHPFDTIGTQGAIVKRPIANAARDPVCGMTVEPSDDISWVHRGHTYYFCSMSCRGRFRASPQQFTGPRSLTAHPHVD